jgi:hypothetical protein
MCASKPPPGAAIFCFDDVAGCIAEFATGPGIVVDLIFGVLGQIIMSVIV